MGRASIINSIKSGWKSFTHSNTGKSIMGALGGFFGLEWLTSGGLVSGASGALGVSNAAGSLLIIIVVILAIYLVFRYLDSQIPNKPAAPKKTAAPRKKR